MAKRILYGILLYFFIFSSCKVSYAGEIDILVEKLVEKKILTESEAREVLSETRREIAKEKEKALPAKWTERIKVKGDIRIRNEVISSKAIGPANSQLRTRLRGRVGIYGKVNDRIKAGVRIASGSSNDPRSTNQTLDTAFTKKAVWIDQAYLAWYPKISFLEDSSLWLGKIPHPIVKTNLVWDGDIHPEGIGFKYVSPSASFSPLSKINAYGNFGMFWLDEISTAETDSMLWILQAGMKFLFDNECDTALDASFAYYNPTHVQHRTITYSPGTNTLFQATHPQYANTLRYDYDMLDFIVRVDNKRFFDYKIPHGLLAEFLVNPTIDSENFGCMVGGYIGDKKTKRKGEWKLYGFFRWLERDALLDALPDGDHIGFTAWGNPTVGGTNAYGFDYGIKYALFKNTVLDIQHHWSTPIESEVIGGRERDKGHHILRADVIVDF